MRQIFQCNFILHICRICRMNCTCNENMQSGPVHGLTRRGTTCAFGSSDFDKIFENCFASCGFGLAKDI
jgi:hypothetical protein